MATTPQQIQALAQAIQQQYTEISPADAQTFAQTLTNEQLSPTDKLGAVQTFAKKYPDFKPEGFFQNPAVKAALIGTGALIGASFLVPALTGGGAAAAGGSEVAASMAPGAELAAAVPAATATASTGFGAALKSALPSIIGAGASVGGSAIAAHGNTEAAKTQAAASEKAAQIQADQLDRALAQAKYIWQTQRADQSGYRSSGNNAMGALDFGLGLPAPSFDAPPVDPSIANPAPTTGVAPGAVDASGKPLPGASTAPSVVPPTMAQQQTNNPNASPLGTSGGGLVPVRSPEGLVKLIPQNDVPSALQAGGTRV